MYVICIHNVTCSTVGAVYMWYMLTATSTCTCTGTTLPVPYTNGTEPVWCECTNISQELPQQFANNVMYSQDL